MWCFLLNERFLKSKSDNLALFLCWNFPFPHQPWLYHLDSGKGWIWKEVKWSFMPSCERMHFARSISDWFFLCRYSAINTKRWHIWQQLRWWWWWMASAATPGISGGSTSGAWSTPRPPTSLHPSYLSLSSLSPSLFRGLSLASYLAPQRTVSANKGRLP